MKEFYHSSNVSIVVDNNVLVDLFELGCIRLMFDIFDKVIILTAIYDNEVSQPLKNHLASFNYKKGEIKGAIGLNVYHVLYNDTKFRKLSQYDRFAIAIAAENTYFCNSNDKLVRTACETLGIKYSGVLGILRRAYVKEKITANELRNYFRLLASDETSCFIDINIITDFEKEIFND